MGLLRHPEHLAHLRRCWSRAADPSLKIALLNQSVLLAELFEVWVLQCLTGTQPVIVVVDEQLANDVDGVRVLWDEFGQASALFLGKVEIHVAGHLLKLV